MRRRGEVFLADLGRKEGSEPGKVRPVLIVQDQMLLDVLHKSTLVVPLTTQLMEDGWPVRVRILAREKLLRDSDVLIDQVRAIDNQRFLGEKLCQLDDTLTKEVDRALLEVLGLHTEYD